MSSGERYVAFMSYSHALDGALAPALQTGVEQFGRQWYRRRALRLFRDSTNLAATPHLWDSIEQALRSSEWFILLASPEAARSVWVRREVDWWLANRSPARLIVVVTSGSVAWDEATGRVDERRTDALPPAFAAWGLPEPLWVDLRLLRVAEPSDPAYQAAVVDIAATLHGRPKDDLVGEQIRQHRKRRRSIALAAAALVILTLVSVIAAGVATVQRDRAEDQTRIATARLLLTQAQGLIASDPRTALLLGEAAQRIHSDPETRAGLGQLIRSTRYEGTLTGHTGRLLAVAFASNGHILATASEDQTVILWDLTDPARPQRIGQPLTGHTNFVRSVAFAPDGHTLATVSDDQTAILWDLTDPTQPQRIGQPLTGHMNHLRSVAFAPDGHTLATGSADASVILWDVHDASHPQRIGQPLTGFATSVESLAFAADGHTLVTSDDRTVILWDLSDPVHPQRIGQPLTGHTSFLRSMALTPDGHTLATSGDQSVILWDLSDPVRPQQIGQPLAHSSSVSSMAFASDGHTLATGSARTVILWDLSDPVRPQRIGQPLAGHTSSVSSVVFAPNGRTLATGSGDQTAMLWDLTDPAQPERVGQPLTGHAGSVSSVAFAADGQTLATGDGSGITHQGSVILWDLRDPAHPQRIGQPLTVHTGSVSSVAFAPDGHTLAVGSAIIVRGSNIRTDVNTAILWDLSDPAHPQRIGQTLTGHTGYLTSVAFAADGHTLATGSGDFITHEGSVILWDLRDPAHPQQIGQPLTVHTDVVQSAVFAPNGHILATASNDRTVILWDVTDPAHPQRIGQPLTGHPGPNGLALGRSAAALQDVSAGRSGARGLNARPLTPGPCARWRSPLMDTLSQLPAT
jgi:WD40 repeat protein